ncbi:MAG TPA: VOC family protein [Paludibacter sp.]|nr:VOC family protein [Paludibacter sp.]
MSNQKIIPSLWFTGVEGNMSSLLEYYKNIFGNKFEEEQITAIGHTPSGLIELCDVKIFGLKYSFMVSEIEHHPLNDAFSLTIICDNQTEIDKYWNYFTHEGEESQCGWCIDKYNLRWQIIPKNLNELMSKPNGWEVMMNQKKIVIEEY